MGVSPEKKDDILLRIALHAGAVVHAAVPGGACAGAHAAARAAAGHAVAVERAVAVATRASY